MIETRYFRITPGRYVRQALSLWFSQWWWAFVLPLIILIGLGTKDTRFYIVALALPLVVYPGLMMLIYFNYALRPEAAWSVLSHKIIFNDSNIEIVFEPSDETPTLKSRHISSTEISDIEDAGTSLIIHLISGKYDFIEVPTSAMTNEDIKQIQKLTDFGTKFAR